MVQGYEIMSHCRDGSNIETNKYVHRRATAPDNEVPRLEFITIHTACDQFE